MKLIKKPSLVILTAGFFAERMIQKASAQCSDTGNTVGSGIDCAGNTLPENLTGGGGIITVIINTLLSIVGVVAVIMIIVGGFRMVVSGGNEKAVADARNTILYAVIGLIVAVLAFAIVNFVLDSL